MKIFLTGYTGGFGRVNGERVACEFNRNNGFFDLLREKLPSIIKCLIMPSNPYAHDENDATVSILKNGFELDNLYNDILVPDSKTRHFYAITDKSFIYCENNRSTLFGEAYLFKDGSYEKICNDGESIIL